MAEPIPHLGRNYIRTHLSRGAPSAKPYVWSRRSKPPFAPRPGRSASDRSRSGEARRFCCSLARRTGILAGGPIRTCTTSLGPSVMWDSARACTCASASSLRGSRARPFSPPWPAPLTTSRSPESPSARTTIPCAGWPTFQSSFVLQQLKLVETRALMRPAAAPLLQTISMMRSIIIPRFDVDVR